VPVVIHELPMRWADLDSLNHVNNVVYTDYAAECRALLAAEGLVGQDDAIAGVNVRFLRPLLLSRHPVTVVSTIGGDVLTQEICVDRDGERTVFARVDTTYGPREDGAVHRAGGDPLPARVRRSDLDETGTVGLTKVFELFQEGRILHISSSLPSNAPGRFVVGSIRVAPVRSFGWRLEPYDMRAWVSRVGGSSFTIGAELADGDRVLARSESVLVGFDLATQRSRRLDDDERVQLEGLLA
jgi:acyl-CoA thioester hydrolase